MKTGMSVILTLGFHLVVTVSLYSQVYPAKGGSLIIFNERPSKTGAVNVSCDGAKDSAYKWPSGTQDFIRSYREASLIFKGPVPLSDDDLTKIWTKMNSMSEFAFSYQYHPALLLALGQAVYLQNNNSIEKCEITIKNAGKEAITKTLSSIDQRELTKSGSKVVSASIKGLSIQLKLIFPKNCWVDSAIVYKRVIGTNDSMLISPIVFTTQQTDIIEMIIRDTLNYIGEYIYTVVPLDQLGMIHHPITGIYAENYNTLSAPRIINFTSEAVRETKTIRLTWQAKVPERIRGFEIYRSSDDQGPFKKVATLSPSDSVYIDHVEGVMQNFFYYVQIIDQTGIGIKSITQFVTPLLKEKPEAPIEPIAEPTSNGVKISWTSWDAMHLTRGYYVYRSGRDSSTVLQVSGFLPIKEGVMQFIDSSEVLKPEIEYRYTVKAESTSYVLSEPSTPMYARPGKRRLVSAPNELQWRNLEDGGLLLYWENMKLADPFIVKYYIAETDADGQNFQFIPQAIIEAPHHDWTNTNPIAGKNYCVVAEDAWGNKSACSTPAAPYKALPNLTPGVIVAHPNTKGYQLQWSVPFDKSIEAVRLYEAGDDHKSILVKSLKPSTTSYVVPLLKPDQAKSFYITFQFKGGKESSPGEAVIVKN